MKLPALFRKHRRKLLVRLVANGVGQAASTIAIAFLVHRVIVRLAARSATPLDQTFAFLIAGLVFATSAYVVLRVLERQDAERLGEDYVRRVRLRLYDALTSAPVLTNRRRGLGPMMLRFVTDLTAVRQWISRGLAPLVVASLATLGGLTAIALIDPLLGLVVTGLVASAALLTVFLGRPLERIIRETRQRRSRLASQIGDRLRALHVVQLSGQVQRERRLVSRSSLKLADAAVARARLASVIRMLPDAAMGFSTIGVLVVGGIRLDEGVASYASIIAALSVLGALSGQVRTLGRVFGYWKNYRIATAKLRDVIATASRSGGRKKRLSAERVEGRLAFQNVSVQRALSDVSATVEPGGVVAVVGPSGAGKSSLLMAAARLLMLDGGTILLDGMDIGALTDETFARHVAMTSPDLPLLQGSVRRNLTYRLREASDEEIADVARMCELDHEIERLPEGLRTRIAGENSNLPLGFRRRLCLARAVLGRPAVLLLDDPQSGLDPAGQLALNRILANRRSTILMATHDFARARSADCLWYMEAGRVVETGTPAALLSSDGPAARFFRSGGSRGARAEESRITYLGDHGSASRKHR